MQPLSEAPEEYHEAIRAACAMKDLAYCPHSDFQVGAALLTSDKVLFKGCNIENVSYSLTICAERTALVKAVSEGKKEFEMIAINSSSDNNGYVTPCGACRQTLAEFGLGLKVYLVDNDYNWVMYTLAELLPHHCEIDFSSSKKNTKQ